MRLPIFLFALSLAVLASAFGPKSKTVNVKIDTDLGSFTVELYPDKAPITVANFLKYVKAGYYEGGFFHRTVKMSNQPGNKVKIEVIQGGPNKQGKDFPPIRMERTNKTGIKHVNGAISMARDTPDTATSDFFICIGNQPSLDFGGKRNPDGQGFAAFGKVTKGMEVVKKIQGAPAKDQSLSPPVRIVGIEVLK